MQSPRANGASTRRLAMIDTKKFLLGWLLLFVAWMAGSFLEIGRAHV